MYGRVCLWMTCSSVAERRTGIEIEIISVEGGKLGQGRVAKVAKGKDKGKDVC